MYERLLHAGIDERSTHRFIVYISLLKLAGQVDLMSLVNPELDDVSKKIVFIIYDLNFRLEKTSYNKLQVHFKRKCVSEIQVKIALCTC